MCIRDRLTQYQIDQGLEAAGLPVLGYLNLNHDVLKLPNGHYILLVSGVQTVNGQSITGNEFIDWDPQQGPVWTWSTFDHISVNHAPYGVLDLSLIHIYSAKTSAAARAVFREHFIQGINIYK